jgi:hypothetical protein
METHLRAALAYIAGRLISGKNSPGVYDYSRSTFVLINGVVKARLVAIYDHGQRCHISGGSDGLRYLLFHHGERRFLNLAVHGNDFIGHDYGRTSRIRGRVVDGSIWLVEEATSREFSYLLAERLDPPWSEQAENADIETDQADPGLPPT